MKARLVTLAPGTHLVNATDTLGVTCFPHDDAPGLWASRRMILLWSERPLAVGGPKN